MTTRRGIEIAGGGPHDGLRLDGIPGNVVALVMVTDEGDGMRAVLAIDRKALTPAQIHAVSGAIIDCCLPTGDTRD